MPPLVGRGPHNSTKLHEKKVYILIHLKQEKVTRKVDYWVLVFCVLLGAIRRVGYVWRLEVVEVFGLVDI